MQRLLAVLALAGLCAACLGPRPWWDKELAAWQGASVSELMAAWGPPDRTITDEDGNPTLVYVSTTTVDRRQDVMADPGKALGKDVPDRGVAQVEDLECSMFFEVTDEVVTATRYDGAGCRVVPRKSSAD